ncbi:MAG TPA: hypothetical protein VGH65_10810 [Verrucomicrobiaceae bacterium]|jgi:hypothetical protein
MKISSLLSLIVIATVLSLGNPVFAKKSKSNSTGGKEDPAAQFDKNHNGRIDPDEAAELQAAFEKNKDGPLKKYDTNHNGNLEKSEIAAIHITMHAKK